MLTEELRADLSEEQKVLGHEEAAHDKRNWVRLTFHCNDHCVFCLDSDTHDGTDRSTEDVKQQILEGRRAGATRLILSGGEPTIHPNFVDFVRLGRMAGYDKVQTVTNGRMFAYQDFITRSIDAGLGEITFSLHGHNAKVHDALVGTKGAFEQETAGLRNALADGRVIVNIDIVLNRGNIRHLPTMLETFYGWGVKEFDLLQVIPFGRAFENGRETLFYDMADAQEEIQFALKFAQKPDVHIWFNRFPPEHLEGYEHLIQDPYKLNDEVRGRKEEYAGLLNHGIDLDCRDPHRCQYCYMERLCDHVYDTVERDESGRFEHVRIDTEWEAAQGPVYGGDPATAKRKRFLPVAGQPVTKKSRSISQLIEMSQERVLSLKAPSLVRALEELSRHPVADGVELELAAISGLSAVCTDGRLQVTEDYAPRLLRVVAVTTEQATELLSMDGDFEVAVHVTKATADWLLSLSDWPARVVAVQPRYERLTEAAEHDVDVVGFYGKLSSEAVVEGVPLCLHRGAREPKTVADTSMMTREGQLEIFRYAKRFIVEHYQVKSLRCATCRHRSDCSGMHVNQVRAHGFAMMQPIE